MSESTQADNEKSLKVWNQQSKTLYPAKTPFKINTFHSTAPVKHRRKGAKGQTRQNADQHRGARWDDGSQEAVRVEALSSEVANASYCYSSKCSFQNNSRTPK